MCNERRPYNFICKVLTIDVCLYEMPAVSKRRLRQKSSTALGTLGLNTKNGITKSSKTSKVCKVPNSALINGIMKASSMPSFAKVTMPPTMARKTQVG